MIQSITEKYRPKSINDLVFINKSFENKMREWISNKSLDSHILLYGLPGLGKSSSINVLINELGVTDVMIINGSDKTGIDDTRKVIDYASIPPMTSAFKIIVFEEFEKLSVQAQDSLKYVLDSYDSWCKFIFTTNNISKVSEPILTRCQQFNFSTLDFEGFIKRVIQVSSAENIKFDIDIITPYVNKFFPGLRSCLNAISQNVKDGVLQPLDNNGVMSLDKFSDIISAYKTLSSVELAKKLSETISSEEYEALYQFLYNHLEMITTDNSKWDMMIKIIAEYLYRNSTVAFPDINFMACLIELKHC